MLSLVCRINRTGQFDNAPSSGIIFPVDYKPEPRPLTTGLKNVDQREGGEKTGAVGLLKNPVNNYAVIYKLLSEKGYFSPKLVKALKIFLMLLQ